MTTNKQTALGWVLGQTGDHKKQFVLAVALAVLGVICAVAPYFFVADIVRGIMNGIKELDYYVVRCIYIAVFWLARVLFHSFSIIGIAVSPLLFFAL